VFVDEFGGEWEHESSYLGAALKLDCPAGKPLGQLVRTQSSPSITYRLMGWGSSRPWPPDPTAVNYAERCVCAECGSRLVGETVAELTKEVNEIHATTRSLEDTFRLRYLEQDPTPRKRASIAFRKTGPAKSAWTGPAASLARPAGGPCRPG
jgi:hypothetical protein